MSASKEIPFYVIIKIAFNRSPYILQRVIPLIALFSTLSMISALNKQNELIILKSVGISIWQLIFPIIIIAFILGSIFISIINPIVSAMYNLSQIYEKQYFSHSSNLITVTSSNVWLKEEEVNQKKIIRADYISNNGKTLDFISVYSFDNNMNLKYRIDAEKAEIISPYILECQNGYKFEDGQLPIAFAKYKVDVKLTAEKLKEGFTSPGSISFWDLPKSIKLFKKAGFSALNHQLYFITLLFIPIQIIVYTILGVLSSFSLVRNDYFYLRITIGVISGLIYFFINEIIAEMSLSSTTSIYFIIAIPLVIAILILLYLILYIEES